MSVDTDSVAALAGVLAAAADRVGGLDPGSPVAAAGAALPDSDAAAVLCGLPAALTRAVSGAADRLRSMSAAAAGAATGYTATDDATAARLAGGGER
ncbi:hypothetical protein [Rhodococcus olei]